MKCLGKCCVALVFACCTPLLIWVGAGAAFYQSRKSLKSSEKFNETRGCSIDSDCPQGYVCLNGMCVPSNA